MHCQLVVDTLVRPDKVQLSPTLSEITIRGLTSQNNKNMNNNADKKIISVIRELDTIEIANNGTGWINLAKLGKELKNVGVEIPGKLEGYFRLKNDLFDIYEDHTHSVKITFVKLKGEVTNSQNSNSVASNYRLEDWAYLHDINLFLDKLSGLALSEDWDYTNGKPKFPRKSILWSYIKYTFCRLQHQNKVAYSIDNQYAAFNTGLVDSRYLYIIALFKRNYAGKKSEWVFYDFVITGEKNGKIINNLFTEEIRPATYTESPQELIYDINLGIPYVDFKHIIIDRVDRLPFQLLTKCGLNYFELKEFVSKEESNTYYNDLRYAIENDPIAYRFLVNRFETAIKLAFKRVSWNYKNAVPMFYPKENRMCLLLPLCLVEDNKEDIALVVKKTPVNKYEGATIIPLDWAYTDARVVSRPNSEWLNLENNNVIGK